MTFVKKSGNLKPIQDTVFKIASLAKKDKLDHPDLVVDASLGSLYDEDGKLVALESVFQHYDEIDARTKASYASSFTGNPTFREAVYNWVIQNQIDALAHSVIATPGGTGAVSSAFTTFLDEGETIILPDIAWGSYTLMASENNLNTAFYTLFEDDHFNLSSLKECIEKVMQKQDRILFVINDPCHNPTGYTMQRKEWEELIQYLNSLPKNKHFIILNDIAYIDYAYSEDKGRHYLSTFNSFDENILALIAFSTSKTLTSYGLRCGAAIILAKMKDDVRDVEIILEKKARATWSNIPNAAMENFTWIVQENREAFLKEKEKYVNLLKERSDLFIEEAKACDLDYYPYHEGFFITLKMKDNAYRDQLHEVLLRNHIYTVQVNKGIRLAICSLPIEKVKGLAKKIKELEGEIH